MASAMTFRKSSIGYRVNHLARLLEVGLRDAIAAHGVAPGQFAQLLALYEHEPLTQTELCRLVRIEQPTMANTLRRMERDGLIVRSIDPHDARRTFIRLAPRARQLRNELLAAATGVNERTTRGLDHAEVERAFDVLGRMIANLEDES